MEAKTLMIDSNAAVNRKENWEMKRKKNSTATSAWPRFKRIFRVFREKVNDRVHRECLPFSPTSFYQLHFRINKPKKKFLFWAIPRSDLLIGRVFFKRSYMLCNDK